MDREKIISDLLDSYHKLDEASKVLFKERIFAASTKSQVDEILTPDNVGETRIIRTNLEEGNFSDQSPETGLISPTISSFEETSLSIGGSGAGDESHVSDNGSELKKEDGHLAQNEGDKNQILHAPHKTEAGDRTAPFITLPNAVVGSEYKKILPDYKPDEVLSFETINDSVSLNELGLNVQGNTIGGTPTQPGEYRFMVSSASEVRKEFFVLLINPDPRSLWKNLEPPKDAPYPKANFEASSSTIEEEGVRIVAGSMRGRSHAHSGTHRDDDFLLLTIAPGLYCLAVADGAGSASFSREGSRLACCELEKQLCSAEVKVDLDFLQCKLSSASSETLLQMEEESKQELSDIVYRLHLRLVQAAVNRIREEVEHNVGSSLRDYSTTLLYSIIVKTENGFITMNYGIGDGLIAHVQSDRVKVLNTPDGGEYSGQTRFLTMSDSIQELSARNNIYFVDKIEGLFLMTDGISDPIFETDSQMTNLSKWSKLQEELLSKGSDVADQDVAAWMEEWLSFWSPGNHDDRTIVFVHAFNQGSTAQ